MMNLGKKVEGLNGLFVNHEEKRIYVFESLDTKALNGDLTESEYRKLLRPFRKNKGYEKIVLHMLFCD